MRDLLCFIMGGVLVVAGLGPTAARAEPVNVVAAENFYGDVAQQLGGANVRVVSILTNPDQDPHLFEASASTGREIAAARIVILNGADYDPWMVKLLSATRAAGRETIEVAKLVHRKAGDNPHLWYDPNTMPALATALAAMLARLDAEHRADYEARLAEFKASLKPLDDEIAALKQAHAGAPVTATEPVFGCMAAAIGLKMRNDRFQLAIMNDTEPSASQIAAFQKDLRSRAVKVLIYNNQTSGELTDEMRTIAKEFGVPVVGVSETAPPGTTFQDWMLSQLKALDAALSGKPP